ncbi:sodium- and chloride-dependent GABA transporter 2-like [Megalops cyprinoides]|uniref:sodium- and chloride-dependent GABA transporter 2-like n=1 Tax=Megalops cyprinoides TaxID=118141 RepID=UPI001864B3AC|nr:sodium- and chloride-dependent GABA transporter 2-like [Megalops cyprinoides]
MDGVVEGGYRKQEQHWSEEETTQLAEKENWNKDTDVKKVESTERKVEERGQWGSKAEFLLAIVGSVVGLGNVWRFPYLCYKNGGGAFLVPYLLFVVACGVPLFLLETAVGQYTRQGLVTCWKRLCPLAEGIGYGGLMIQLYNCVCYIIILAWALLYLMFSFSSNMPWASCSNTWNTANCVEVRKETTAANWTRQTNATSAAMEFWERRVLSISGGIGEVGHVRWELALCLMAVWATCYFCIWKGVKSTGKAVYFTATFPYLMLLVLLVRGLTLPGAFQGIVFYLYPEPARLADPQVWLEAGAQIFFSYSVGAGGLTVLGSYNTYNNNCYKDCWLCLLNSGTSFVAGFAVFSVLGFMAHELGVPIEKVAESGPGLAFIAYPQATSMMPFPQIWASCFFIMIILLGLDTQFVSAEVVITSVSDLFPALLRRVGGREIFLLFFCVFCFLTGLLMVTEGGMYAFQLVDYYGSNGVCLVSIAIFESLTVGWVFGPENLYDVIEDMAGVRPNALFKFCWRYLTPLVSLGSLIFYFVKYKPLTFNHWYVYPDWAYTLGWLMALSSIVMAPCWGILKLCIARGTMKQRLSNLCHPDDDLPLTQKHTAEQQPVTSGMEMVVMITEEPNFKTPCLHCYHQAQVDLQVYMRPGSCKADPQSLAVSVSPDPILGNTNQVDHQGEDSICPTCCYMAFLTEAQVRIGKVPWHLAYAHTLSFSKQTPFLEV